MITISLVKYKDGVDSHLRERFGSRTTPSPADTILALAGLIGRIVEDEMRPDVNHDEAWAYWKERVCDAMEKSAKGKGAFKMDVASEL